MKRQLFILDSAMLTAMSVDEVKATYADMIELQINKPPYMEFTIQIPFGMIAINLVKSDAEQREFLCTDQDANRPLRIDYDLRHFSDSEAQVICNFNIEHKGKWIDAIEQIKTNYTEISKQNLTIKILQNTASYILTYLIVALATKNVERKVKYNSLAKFGIGKKKRGADYDYVTTLSIGKLVEYEGPSTYTGETKRPHLRRGHIRRQKYGPSLTYERKIWIEPIFVNGYSPEQDHRKAYNVKAH